MHFRKNIIIFVNIYINCASGTDMDKSHRSRRQLVFPNSTVLQVSLLTNYLIFEI